MAVRIPLRLRSVSSPGTALRSTAVVNTGFETDRPEVLLPSPCAEALGLYPQPPAGARVERYDTAGGSATFWRIPDALRVAIEDAEASPIPADALVSELDRELLLNDVLAGDLGIVILNPRTGDWRRNSDPAHHVRPTERRQLW